MADGPDRIALESGIARALEAARARCGLTQEEMVRALSPYQSRPSRHQQRWHDWLNRPRSLSSVALVAAARMARTSVDALLGEASGREPADEESEAEPGEYQEQLAQVAAVVARLSQTVETQGVLLDRIAEQVLGRTRGSTDLPEAVETRRPGR